MNSVNVWFADTWLSGLQVRLNAGEAIDASDGYAAPLGVLYFDGDLNEILCNTTTVYRFNADYLSRSFYFSKEAALEAAEKAGLVDSPEGGIQEGHICPAQYKRVELPVEVFLNENERGLYCRMNLHPEIFGTRQKGKMYFVDKSCLDTLCVGPAVITKVFERTSYGFMVGHMKQFDPPSDLQLAVQVAYSGNYKQPVRFCTNKFGRFAKLGKKCFVLKDGIPFSDYDLDTYDNNATVYKEVIGEDLVCQVYHGCQFEELVSKFGSVDFDLQHSIPCHKHLSPLFEEAVSSGFIELRTYSNVDFVCVNEKKLADALDQFNRGEMKLIYETCAEINKGANESIRSGTCRT